MFCFSLYHTERKPKNIRKQFQFLNFCLKFIFHSDSSSATSSGSTVDSDDSDESVSLYHLIRAVANLTVPGGQEFHFPHFCPQIFNQFLLFFLKLILFSSSFWASGWASRPPGKALATPPAFNTRSKIKPYFITVCSSK